MDTDSSIVKARVAIPLDLYRQLQHAAVDKGVRLGELLARGARLAAEEALGTDPKQEVETRP